MVRTAFQSDIFKSIVAKLSYCVRSSYQIIYSTGCGSYFVRKINKPDSTELKFMAYDLYTLLLFLKSCEHVDTTNIHYLKQTYIPLVNIFKRALHVKLYDENCFNKKIKLLLPIFLINKIHYSLLMKLLFNFLLCQNSIKKLKMSSKTIT